MQINVKTENNAQTGLAFELEIDVIIADQRWLEKMDEADLNKLIRKAVLNAIEIANPAISGPGEISIVLSNDAHVQELNMQWRQIDKPTNVLSFSQIEPFAPLAGILGDIILSLETLENEAKNNQLAFSDHLSHLIVHGFVHILGYDHQNDKEADEMESLEIKILSNLRIANPYAD
ncbi:Metal-dependent hydrolase YbeY, involved in rRNA and/or ribosome maturation and assembly [hydrothermal vent metagenome]|uniref:Metal-dependent hydrolase YbeY, involved in rRNA and/or ribosome maturation and assembly n=1 Tax=hydrothermal vent metagenome TaxID=652676 RepID=A0A3B0TK17_9ZZZZ